MVPFFVLQVMFFLWGYQLALDLAELSGSKFPQRPLENLIFFSWQTHGESCIKADKSCLRASSFITTAADSCSCQALTPIVSGSSEQRDQSRAGWLRISAGFR